MPFTCSTRKRTLSPDFYLAGLARALQRKDDRDAAKTRRTVQFEITQTTQKSVEAWIQQANLRSNNYLFSSRIHRSHHIGNRHYARILHGSVKEIGLCSATYGTHSMLRSKATMIYKKTKNLRAVPILLGHTKLESTVRYLGIEMEDALDLPEQLDV